MSCGVRGYTSSHCAVHAEENSDVLHVALDFGAYYCFVSLGYESFDFL